MPLQYQTLTVNNFSGGMSDRFVNVNPIIHEKIMNMSITELGTLESREGFDVFFEADTNQRIMGMWDFNGTVYAFRNQLLYYYDGGALTDVAVPNAEPFFQFTGNDVYPEAIEWRDQLFLTNTGQKAPVQYNRPMRAWIDNLAAKRAVEMGLPKLASTPTAAITGAGTAYLVEIHYSYSFQVGDVTYRNVGPINIQAVDGADGGTLTVTGIPIISALNNQLDTTNIDVEIYLTKGGLIVPYRIQTITNGTTAITPHVVDDATVDGNPAIYTNGGFVEQFPAPKCKYMTVVNDVPYFANIVEELDAGDELRPYRLQQGIPGNPSAIDPASFKDLDDEIEGISHIGSIPIVFTKSFIYRVDGVISIKGNGTMRTRVIDSTIGCLNHRSIVRAPEGLFWFGNNGVYATNGSNIQPMTPLLDKSYRKLTDTLLKTDKIQGTYDPFGERILWVVGDNDTENNKTWVLNLKTGGFSEWDGLFYFASSILYKDNELLRGDDLGYIYSHRDELNDDLIRDENTAVANWNNTHVPFYFKSQALDFGNSGVRKWVSHATATVRSETNFNYRMRSDNDNSGKIKDLKEVRRRTTFFWNDPNFVWNDDDIAWRTNEIEVNQRHFPRNGLRCRRKQVIFEPYKGIRYTHENFNTADVAELNLGVSSDLTVTLPVGVTWPTDVVLDTIYFASDNYATPHTIKIRSDQTLTVSGGGTVLATGINWRIEGFFRKQRVELKEIVLKFAMIDDVGNRFQASEDGTPE